MKFQPKASHFINGAYVEDTNGAPIDVIYPATGEVIARLHSATPEIVDQALTSAKAAQASWAAMSGTERGRILRRAADIMRERNRELSILETHDTGKPLQETLVADATSGADALEYFGGLAASLTGEHIPLGGGDFVYTIREALGVCVGIGAWNYPTQIACWKGAPAMACGNTMIFKPSESTPLSALQVAEILIEAGAPKGVYNVVQGYGEVGASLVTDRRVCQFLGCLRQIVGNGFTCCFRVGTNSCLRTHFRFTLPWISAKADPMKWIRYGQHRAISRSGTNWRFRANEWDHCAGMLADFSQASPTTASTSVVGQLSDENEVGLTGFSWLDGV